jgi:hypothetical protein
VLLFRKSSSPIICKIFVSRWLEESTTLFSASARAVHLHIENSNLYAGLTFCKLKGCILVLGIIKDI